MHIDITLTVTPRMLAEALANPNPALTGHLGTHFDVMDKEFPLSYTERRGLVFDVRGITHRDIRPEDVALSAVGPDMFVAFCTGYGEAVEYGEPGYFSHHPQLAPELIDALLDKGVSIIGIDCAGIRRGAEHTPTDQRCADRGVFVVENLCRLDEVLRAGGRFTACTYPMRCTGITGLPCRVIARTEGEE